MTKLTDAGMRQLIKDSLDRANMARNEAYMPVTVDMALQTIQTNLKTVLQHLDRLQEPKDE